MDRPEPRWARFCVVALAVVGAWRYLLSYFEPQLLLLDTMVAGGDTPSFLRPVHHLRDTLLPAGLPQGWDLGNFAGYAPYQYYFLPPSLLILLLGKLVPLNAAFKLVTASGSFLLPLGTALALLAMGYRGPIAAIGASASLLFLFNEGNSMWGGNIPSTLAGEFAHSLGFAFAVLFVGLFYRGVQRGRGWRLQAAVLAFAGLCHPVAFLNAATPGVFFLFDRRNFSRNIRWIVRVYGTAVLLMGFWLVPLIGKIGYATSINWKWIFQSWRDVTPAIFWPVFRLAALDVLWMTVGPKRGDHPARQVAFTLAALLLALGLPPTVVLERWVHVPLGEVTWEWCVLGAVAVLGIALAVWDARRTGRHGVRTVWSATAEDGPAAYLLVGAVATTLLFFNATTIGLPEIRFVPFVYLLLILLAVDVAARVLAPARAAHLGGLALAVAVAAWAHANTSFTPTWIRWNYEGLERKPSWPLLKSLMDAVHGTIQDPRVAYENSPQHERFGSMRVFEDMALLSGRATLEGVLLQTAVTSPFVYWLQSQISKQGTGVIPGYSYPSMDPVHATPRLKLFNAQDLIAITPEIIGELDKDPRWMRLFANPPYVVFRMKDADPHYVRVPRYRPVAIATRRWKLDFHRWFATDGALDVPIVRASDVGPADRARFLASDTPTHLPHEPIAHDCQIDEHIDHLAIEFTTTCPGEPHWIAVSYSPNWQVDGADRVFLASPAFMLVFPNGPHVRLAYRRIGVDWLGIGATLAGLLVCAVPLRRRGRGAALDGLLVRGWPILVPLTTGAVLLVTGWNVARDILPSRYYYRGWDAFSKQNYPQAIPDFEGAIFFGGESNTAADATFFRAASLLRSGKPAEAMAGYQTVIDRFPGAIWVAEAHYHVGLCLQQLGAAAAEPHDAVRRRRAARDRFRYVISTYPGNRWAGFAAEQLAQLRKVPPPRRRRG
ncbi:MAG: 6-pyruvoyl-tetrahydropterin synthase-related protein [Candidatus Binatia bacterium]